MGSFTTFDLNGGYFLKARGIIGTGEDNVKFYYVAPDINISYYSVTGKSR
jgi:hypothetical protein